MSTSELIYKRDSQGRVRFWHYEVQGPKWRSISGIVGSEMSSTVATNWTTCSAKSQDTDEAQAQFEADAELKKKLDRVYRPSIEELATATDMMFEPMLAKNWVMDARALSKGVYLQPKLDGIRCIATIDGLFTRQGREIVGLPHIEAALAPIFEERPTLVLDGELYNHEYQSDFEKIVSAVRKTKGISPDAGKIQYHVYDCFDPMKSWRTFSDRTVLIDQLFGGVPVVSCVSVTTLHVDSLEGFNEVTSSHLEMGYEGSMVRLDEIYDKGKRSKSLLKVKLFEDAEFDIVEILEGEGNWAGYGKKIRFRLEDGRVCGAGVKGDQAFTKRLLCGRDEWVGRKVTVKFFGRTNDGMPRFPVAIKFWEEEKV